MKRKYKDIGKKCLVVVVGVVLIYGCYLQAKACSDRGGYFYYDNYDERFYCEVD